MMVDGGFALTKENYIVPTSKVTLIQGFLSKSHKLQRS